MRPCRKPSIWYNTNVDLSEYEDVEQGVRHRKNTAVIHYRNCFLVFWKWSVLQFTLADYFPIWIVFNKNTLIRWLLSTFYVISLPKVLCLECMHASLWTVLGKSSPLHLGSPGFSDFENMSWCPLTHQCIDQHTVHSEKFRILYERPFFMKYQREGSWQTDEWPASLSTTIILSHSSNSFAYTMKILPLEKASLIKKESKCTWTMQHHL